TNPPTPKPSPPPTRRKVPPRTFLSLSQAASGSLGRYRPSTPRLKGVVPAAVSRGQTGQGLLSRGNAILPPGSSILRQRQPSTAQNTRHTTLSRTKSST